MRNRNILTNALIWIAYFALGLFYCFDGVLYGYYMHSQLLAVLYLLLGALFICYSIRGFMKYTGLPEHLQRLFRRSESESVQDTASLLNQVRRPREPKVKSAAAVYGSGSLKWDRGDLLSIHLDTEDLTFVMADRLRKEKRTIPLKDIKALNLSRTLEPREERLRRNELVISGYIYNPLFALLFIPQSSTTYLNILRNCYELRIETENGKEYTLTNLWYPYLVDDIKRFVLYAKELDSRKEELRVRELELRQRQKEQKLQEIDSMDFAQSLDTTLSFLDKESLSYQNLSEAKKYFESLDSLNYKPNKYLTDSMNDVLKRYISLKETCILTDDVLNTLSKIEASFEDILLTAKEMYSDALKQDLMAADIAVETLRNQIRLNGFNQSDFK